MVSTDRSDDSELIAQTLSGNTRAFARLVEKYERSVAATVCGMLGTRGGDADEIGQQVFIRFYESLHKFRGESSVRTYLTRIAINLSLNELKRRKRRFSRLQSLTNEETKNIAAVDSADEISHDHALIEQALQKLTPEMREVVVLRLINGYSSEETATMLKIPIGTVLSRLSIARKKLRTLLSPYFGGDYERSTLQK